MNATVNSMTMVAKIVKMGQEMDSHTSRINSLYDWLLALEHYSRSFNFRVYKVPESSDEDCIDILGNIISNDLNLKPVIENAHRIDPQREMVHHILLSLNFSIIQKDMMY